MRRRDALKLAATAPALLRAQSRTRPNILMLMTDQHRVDCVGAYGNRWIHTPHIDRLAREGVRFDCAYSSTPTCTPARSALLTGLAPWHHGMLGYTNMAERYPLEKPRALAAAGYSATAIGKNHFYPMRNSHGYRQMVVDEACSLWIHTHPDEASAETRCDYESWLWSQNPLIDPHATGLSWNDYRARAFALPENLHPTRWTADTAVNFLRQYDRPQPFFLKVSFLRPHSPYDPPGRHWRTYANETLPDAQAGAWAKRYEPRSGRDNEIWHGRLDEEEVRNSRHGYYASVGFVDEQIGRVLEVLEQRKLLDETLIVFLSDHGDMLGDQNLWRKSYAYQQSAHIPMLMRWPTGLISAKRGSVRTEPVELRDILPTFLDAAQSPALAGLDGRSLLALTAGQSEGWRPWIDLEHNICYSPSNNWNALTDGRQKYIFHARDGEEQLFDLTEDPDELTDLAGDAAFAADLRRWRGRMLDHLSERGERYVAGGKLTLRPGGIMTSPHFPGYPKNPPRPGVSGPV